MAIKVLLKHEEQFKSYLSTIIENPRVIGDCISRCKRVQKHEGDLEEHFFTDKGQSLLEKLAYTMVEANRGIPPKHSIEFQGKKGFKSIYEGTHSLNTAVKHYFEFLRKY